MDAEQQSRASDANDKSPPQMETFTLSEAESKQHDDKGTHSLVPSTNEPKDKVSMLRLLLMVCSKLGQEEREALLEKTIKHTQTAANELGESCAILAEKVRHQVHVHSGVDGEVSRLSQGFNTVMPQSTNALQELERLLTAQARLRKCFFKAYKQMKSVFDVLEEKKEVYSRALKESKKVLEEMENEELRLVAERIMDAEEEVIEVIVEARRKLDENMRHAKIFYMGEDAGIEE